MRQDSGLIVHLVNYHANRRGAHVEVVERVIPLRDVRLAVRLPAAPTACYVAPERTPLPVDWRNATAEVVVPVVREHAMVVFELEENKQ